MAPPPRSLRGAARTVIGALDAEQRASVDPSGTVHLDGQAWGLHWWIGAEDRWHLPAEEVTARQRLVGSSPVVETRVRVPSGDAVHRVYAARDPAGAPVVVVEIENDSKVPFAVALAVRGPGLDGGSLGEVSAEGTEVRVGDRLALISARAPGRRLAMSEADGDLAEVVRSGGALPEAAVAARCRAGSAAVAVVFPLAHGATLRVVLPLEGGAIDVTALPTAAQVASGWRTHARRGARIDVPDRRLQDAVDSNLCHLLVRPQGLRVTAALLRFGFFDEARAEVLGDPVQTAVSDTPGETLLAVTAFWTLTRDTAFAEQAVPVVAALMASIGRSRSRPDRALGAIAATGAANLMASVGQHRAADDLRRAGEALAAVPGATRPPAAPTGVDPIFDMLRTASPTWTWVGPADGHDLDVGAALLVAARALLVAEVDGPQAGLQLAGHVPDDWLGQGWEAHGLPTAHGTLSYAVRWHGERPALLWELEPWAGAGPVRIAAPRLDPGWSTDKASGDALLAPLAVPVPSSRGLRIPVTIEPAPPKRPR